MIAAALLMLAAFPATLLADEPLDISTTYDATKTYTIQSASGYQMYVNSSGNLTSENSVVSSTPKTDEAYLFAFVSDGKDNSVYYLYSVKAKKFVTSVTGSNTTAYLYTIPNELTPVYVYDANIDHCYNSYKATYNRAIAFDGNQTFPTSNTGLVNSNNNSNHVLEISSSGAHISQWNYLGGGGNYNHRILETSVEFTADQLTEARQRLERLTYTATTFADIASALATDSKVYTLLDEAGNYLSATTSGLTSSSTNTAAAQQFVFFTNPSDATKVYLYSVGQQKFVTATGMSVGADAAASPIYAYTTGDTHGYSLALAFNGDAWGTNAISTAGIVAENADPSVANRFKVEEASSSSYSKGWATTLFTGVYSKSTLNDLGIDPNKVYYLYSENYIVLARGNSNNLDRYSRAAGTALNDTANANTHFAFVTDKDDPEKVYFYSLYFKKALGDDNSFVSGNQQQTYVYYTGSKDFPLALGFSDSWDATGAKSVWASSGVTENSALSTNNRFKFVAVRDADYNLEDARIDIKGTYDATTFQAANLTTDNVVYTLTSEAGSLLYAGTNGLEGNATAEASDPKAQFVFYKDTETGNVYLYSVGKGQFITSSKGYASGASAGQLYVFSTSHSEYSLAFGFNETWATGPAINTDGSSTTAVSTANRFKLNAVSSEQTKYNKTWAANAFNGVYTLSTLQEMGIDPNKVYYITSDAINSSNQHIIVGGSGSEIGWYTQNSGKGLSDLDEQYHKSTHFAFVTDPDDNSKIYLYSVNASKALNSSGGLVATKANVQRIYVYATGNSEFPLAFGFSGSWDADDAKNLDGSCNNSTNKLISSTKTIGSSKRFKLTEIDDASYSLQLAHMNLFPPFHYKGASGRAFKSNGMQATAEYHYYYYVSSTTKQYKRNEMNAIDLNLPLMYYLERNNNGDVVFSGASNKDSHGNNMEPMAYFRWYDYTTDRMPADGRIGKWEEHSSMTNQLSELFDSDGTTSLGYVCYHLSKNYGGLGGPGAGNIGVYYKIPTDEDYDNWNGDVIACDVARYADYNVPMNADTTGNYTNVTASVNNFVHEPTLSIRYIFHILPAEKLAADIRNQLLATGRGEMKTYNDKGVFSWGVYNSSSSTMNLRTNLQSVDNFWFYPLIEPETHHVYHPDDDDTNSITGTSQFGTELKQATSLEWRVYNADKTAWRIIATGTSRNIDISVSGTNGLNGSGWKTLANGSSADDNTIAVGDKCYLVGLAVASDGSKCPFFNAELNLTPYYPKSDAQIAADENERRTDNYLTEHYGSPVAQFTFDRDNSDQDYSQPTSASADNNLTKTPGDFATRQYSFVYSQLEAFSSTRDLGYNQYWGAKISPLHGDYSLYKQFGSVGTDHTNYKDKSRFGYFLYIDASDESRQIGAEDFEGSLCSGTDLVVSAYVNNNTGIGNGNAQPELRFTLYGIEKDAQNNVTSERPLASVCSGKFDNNIDDYANNQTGVWYQVFGVMNLPSDLNVERYTDFRIGIDNFCNSTQGADYAIDDITVYQNPSKLMVIQTPPVCRDGAASDVWFKIKGGYEMLHSQAKKVGDTRKVFYRFYTSDGNAVTGIYNNDDKEYGEAAVPEAYSATATLGAEDDNCLQFETTEAGQELLVLANRHFNLSLTKTYYVSVALPKDDGTPGEWGKPSDVCSYYSNQFSVVVQNLVINSEENGTALVDIACTEDKSTKYTITASITAPDHLNGGKINLPVKFDWYAGKLSEFQAAKTGDLYLEIALQHFRTVYPDATDLTPGPDGVYTAEDKALLQDSVWASDDAHKNNRLIINGSMSLTSDEDSQNYPISPGVNTFTAIIAAKTEVDANGTAHKVITYNESTYMLCYDPMEFTIRAVKNGPRLDFGISGIQYPSGETTRAIRVGFPQMRSMGSNGYLRVPISARYFGETVRNDEELRIVGDDGDTARKEIYISATNDPTIDLSGDLASLRIADVVETQLASTDTTLNLCNFNTNILHEGYWYETSVRFMAPNEKGDFKQCPGETFFRIKVVPEYLTWAPTADNGLSSNWNNDLNWRRSTAAELFKPDYTDYRIATDTFNLYSNDGSVAVEGKTNPVDAGFPTASTQPQSYTPMYFSKVTIPTLTTQPYPMLGFIRRNATTGLVQRMTNGKASAPTTNIEYDMMAMATETAKGSTTDSIYKCSVFDGNVCEQIWFKTGAQLRAEQYLRYRRAWCELELPVNSWGTFTSPMASTFAGEMYLTKYSARQETEGFREIHFDDKDEVYLDEQGNATYDSSKKASSSPTYGLFGKAGAGLYNRLRMPTYQMSWGRNEEEVTEDGNYGAHDNPTQMLIYPSVEGGDDMNLEDRESYTLRRNAWSHVFNDMSLKYEPCVGMAGKIGNDYATPTGEGKAWNGKSALMRLPKSDDQYVYYKRDGNGSTAANITAADATATDHYRLAVGYDNTENSLGQMQHRTYSVIPYPQVKQDGEGYTYDYEKANQYVLMANPYTATISVQRFVEANQNELAKVNRDGQEVYRVWTYYNNVLYELAPDGVSSIAPGQAFFIRVETPGRGTVTFTERMQIDPNISSGSTVEAAARAPKRITYTVKSADEVTKALSAIDAAGDVQMWSPREGWVAVSGATDLRIGVYSTDGAQIHTAQSSAGATKQLYTGKGIFVVRASPPDGKTIARKLAVK